ncbi:uncharacterized protein LOC132707993 isoform X2 [Cylas formicarius]|uniref:uncharacterized protein LOC132707993 isoform X2 n=1 Tax=Cylas formicarius TaxID=197179 RepID=UPI002958D02B|nr:uncharacterized protein LOC132707993 isoform X2 [Cylas formicarius]
MENFKEVYRTHIEGSLDNSDNESVNSNQSSLYENWKPIPYTDKEIESNTAVIVKPKEVDNFWGKRRNVDFPDTLSAGHSGAENWKVKMIESKKQQNLGIGWAIRKTPQNNENGVAFCTICDVKIMTEEHYVAHFNASPHKMVLSYPLDNSIDESLKFAQNQRNVDNLSFPKELKALMTDNCCKLCNRSFNDTDAFSKHYQLPQHKENLELWLQNKSSFSQENFDAAWPEELKNLVLPNACWLCDVKIASPSVLLSHYGSRKHIRKLLDWKSTNTASVKINKSPSTAVVIQKPTSSKHCYICDVDFKLHDAHVQSVMHCETFKFALSMISIGVPIWDFWLKAFRKVISEHYCSLCGCQLTGPAVALSHFRGKKHITNFQSWVQANSAKMSKQTSSTEIPIKWLYCEVCKQELDGTSFAEAHYKSHGHKEKQQYFCFICKIASDDFQQYKKHHDSVSHKRIANNGVQQLTPCNTSENCEPSILYSNSDDIRNKLELHRANVSKSATSLGQKEIHIKGHLNQYTSNVTNTIENQSSRSINLNQNININLEQKTANDELKEEVLSELKKFVNLIYMSKTIPLNSALKHLKRYNKELESLKVIEVGGQNDQHPAIHKQDASDEKYSKLVKFPKFKNENESENETTPDGLKVTNSKCDQIFPETGHLSYSTMTHNSEAAITINSEKNSDFKDTVTSEAAISINSPKNRGLKDKETNSIKQEACRSHKVDQNLDLSEKQGTDCVKQQKLIDYDELVLSFINNGCAIQFSNEDNDVEKEVVKELSDFIQTVYHSDDLPLDVILLCLKRFNEELEIFTDQKQSSIFTTTDGKQTLIENGTELVEGPKVESKPEYIEDIQNVDQIAKHKVHCCEDIDKTLPKKKRLRYNKKIITKDSAPMEVDILHDSFNCHYYDYADENFDQYIKFREMYLFGSLNNIQINKQNGDDSLTSIFSDASNYSSLESDDANVCSFDSASLKLDNEVLFDMNSSDETQLFCELS